MRVWTEVLLICSVLCSAIDACPRGIKGYSKNFDGTCYHLVDDRDYDWESAAKVCEVNGGHLGSIKSHKVDVFLQEELIPGAGDYWGNSKKSIWIGAIKPEKRWHWHEKEDPLAYSNWDEGEPDPRGNNRRCAVMSQALRWQWMAVSCSATPSTYYILCQYESEPHSLVNDPTFQVVLGVGCPALLIILVIAILLIVLCRKYKRARELLQQKSTPADKFSYSEVALQEPSVTHSGDSSSPPAYGAVIPGFSVHPPEPTNNLNLDTRHSKHLPNKTIDWLEDPPRHTVNISN